MIKKNSLLILVIVLSITHYANSQSESKVDSLLKKTFKELFLITEETKDSAQRDYYANVLVKKGELMKKTRGSLVSKYCKSVGYQFLANNRYSKEESLAYADSIIMTMGDEVALHFPAVAYQIKGEYHFVHKSYQKALENFLLVLSKAEEANNLPMIFRGKHDLADLKRQIGKPEEALKLYKENLSYISIAQDTITAVELLKTIASIANVYNDQKKTDSANFYNKYGLKEAKRLKDDLYHVEFALNQGITLYHKRNFQIAIDSFEKHIPFLKDYKNSTKLLPERLALSHFYAGKSYLELENRQKAIQNFKAIDSLFKVEKSLFPSVRESYEYLIKHYKSKNDKEGQLQYINQLIKVDSILYADKLYLNKGIIMEYDVPKLKFEKQNTEEELAKQKRLSRYIIIILSTLIFILIIALIIQYKNRQRFKKRFQKIIEGKPLEPKKNTSVDKSDSKTIDIQENVIKDILDGLESFEKKHGYLSKKITLTSLSKKLGTNPNYLSKIINHYKKCSFTKYLNTLRVEHSIEQLKTNSTYRKYTIKAIAEEVGFNNVQAFAKAFYHNKGINPSYFLKELNKSIQPSDK